MAKLVRKNHKVFGANANVNDMGQFGSALNTTKLNTKDIDEIQALDAWENGWNDGVVSGNRYPSLQERNALDYEHSYQTGYLLQEGIPEWEENTEYSDSSIIKAIEDNKVVLYRSLQNNNKNNTVTNTEYWKKVSLGGSYHPPILSCMWSDHLINDIQWLRADTFSWQSGDVYTTVYDKLVEEYATGTEETEGSITFKRTTNGFKIALATQESAILDKYNTDGIAWYYILDITNKRFKLPRTKFGFDGLRTNVGDDIDERLPKPSHTHTRGDMEISGGIYNAGESLTGGHIIATATGAFSTYYNGGLTGGDFGVSSNGGTQYYDFYASRSWTGSTSQPNGLPSVYQDNAPVQERATQMYLYFYVGEYTREVIEQTAGLNTELFNGKLDLNASGLSTQGKSYVAGLSFPSLTKYTDLVIGASGTAYTAPADGYIWLCANCITTSTSYMIIAQDKWQDERVYASNYVNVNMMCPVAKGTYYILYANMDFQYFRFIYAEGSQPQD